MASVPVAKAPVRQKPAIVLIKVLPSSGFTSIQENEWKKTYPFDFIEKINCIMLAWLMLV
jgi:hypothetical protein